MACTDTAAEGETGMDHFLHVLLMFENGGDSSFFSKPIRASGMEHAHSVAIKRTK
jgi:hypothetical protein